MAVTHQDIAEELGIARSVVTHVLHGSSKSRVHEDTRREIETIARRMGYTPRNRTTHTIAYVLSVDSRHDIEKTYLEAENVISLRVERAARAAGYRTTIIGMSAEDNFDSLSGMLNVKNVDGVIFSCWYDGRVRSILPPSVPWVLTAEADGIPDDVDVVTADLHATGKALVQRLIKDGHRQFGLVTNVGDIKVHREVKRGAREALQLAGIPVENLRLLDVVSLGDIMAPLREAMQQPNAPTAWIGTSSGLTIAVLLALYSLGIKIPSDVSLASLLDSPQFAALPCPILSTNAMGTPVAERAVSRLIAKIKDPELPPYHERFVGSIVEHTAAGPVSP